MEETFRNGWKDRSTSHESWARASLEWVWSSRAPIDVIRPVNKRLCGDPHNDAEKYVL